MKRLPAIYVWRRYVDAGDLMSYGPSFYKLWRDLPLCRTSIMPLAHRGDHLPIKTRSKLHV